jgi:hypothetical protein
MAWSLRHKWRDYSAEIVFWLSSNQLGSRVQLDSPWCQRTQSSGPRDNRVRQSRDRAVQRLVGAAHLLDLPDRVQHHAVMPVAKLAADVRERHCFELSVI